MWTLGCAVFAPASVFGAQVAPELVQSTIFGTQLAPDDAEVLEDRLRGNPHDSTARLQLIGYHWSRQYADSASAERHGQLVLWMIRNDPRSPLLEMPYGHVERSRNPEIL